MYSLVCVCVREYYVCLTLDSAGGISVQSSIDGGYLAFHFLDRFFFCSRPNNRLTHLHISLLTETIMALEAGHNLCFFCVLKGGDLCILLLFSTYHATFGSHSIRFDWVFIYFYAKNRIMCITCWLLPIFIPCLFGLV